MIKIDTKYKTGKTVFFLHNSTIVNGEIVSVNFSELMLRRSRWTTDISVIK